jgi:hypothetical protein
VPTINWKYLLKRTFEEPWPRSDAADHCAGVYQIITRVPFPLGLDIANLKAAISGQVRWLDWTEVNADDCRIWILFGEFNGPLEEMSVFTLTVLTISQNSLCPCHIRYLRRVVPPWILELDSMHRLWIGEISDVEC